MQSMVIEDTNPDNRGTGTVVKSQNFDNKWQNKGCYTNNYSNKSKFEILRKGKFNKKYDNKTSDSKLNTEQVTELIKATIKCIMQQNVHKDVYEVKQQHKTDNTTTTK